MITEYKIPVHSKEWYDFRTVGARGYEGGIGASESAKVTGLDKQYRPTVHEMFWQKIGLMPVTEVSNIATEYGKVMEPFLRDIWQFWTGNDEAAQVQALQLYQKWKVGSTKPIRTYGVNSAYLVNEKYPWLFASLDAKILAGNPRTDGVVIDVDAPLECKTIGFWAASQWEQRIPPKYANQVYQQMIVTGSKYGELIAMEQSSIRLYEFHENLNFQQYLIQKTYEFWQKVLKGRELCAQMHEHDEKGREQIMGEIQALEPEPDESEAYREFETERMKLKYEYALGGVTDYRRATVYKKLTSVIKALEAERSLLYNQLLRKMSEQDTNKIVFRQGTKDIGYVSRKSKFAVELTDYNPDVDSILSRVKEVVKSI
jgi:hypothetical protein